MKPANTLNPVDVTGGNELLSAREACGVLQIKPATLYTYVSRGLLHPISNSGRKSSSYRREDVESLRMRSDARKGHGAVAASAMHWGQPVISTAISEITPDGPRYRGHLATDLVRHPGQFENVAELLWSGVLPDERNNWPSELMPSNINTALKGMDIAFKDPIRMMRVFSVAATALGGGTLAEEVRNGSITRCSREMIFAFAGCCGLLGETRAFVAPEGDRQIAEHILAALDIAPTVELIHALNAALIVGADHEMASSTFVARIAASTGAGLHACIVAALATHTGSRLTGGCNRVEDLMRGLTSMPQVTRQVAEADRHRASLPGFSMPLYPRGDPRALCLIELAKANPRQSRHSEFVFRFLEEVQTRVGIFPSIDAGIVALCITYGLPSRMASALWGIGRSAGWIAHSLEQRLSGVTLRPRGQFRPV